MAFSTGLGQQPRYREVPAGDLAAVQREIDRAKVRFGLPAAAQVASCYKAGRDGFMSLRTVQVVRGREDPSCDAVPFNTREPELNLADTLSSGLGATPAAGGP